MLTRFLILTLLVLSVFAFDKNTVRKGKRDPLDKSQLHPISRRVLRFERSVGIEEHFPRPDQLPYPIMDFAKVLPELPIKYKPSNMSPDQDYPTEMDF